MFLTSIIFLLSPGWYSLSTFHLSFNLVTIIQALVLVSLVCTLCYFVFGEYTIDSDTINWTRFGHYLFAVFLYSLFMQSIGLTIGVIYAQSVVSGLAVTIVVYVLLQMPSDFFFKTSDMDNIVFNEVWGDFDSMLAL